MESWSMCVETVRLFGQQRFQFLAIKFIVG